MDYNVIEQARDLKPEEFAKLLEQRCNSYHMDAPEGVQVGEALRNSHRTLQATTFRYLVGIIIGLSHQEQRFTDARNEVAVRSAKRIADMVEHGELELGYMI